MDKSDVLQIFNRQFKEFVENISESFPKNTTISKMKTALNLLIVVKPNLVYKGVKKFVIDMYRNEIDSGDITFFIDKDYNQDLSKASGSESFLKTVNEYATIDSDSNSILEKIEGYLRFLMMHYSETLKQIKNFKNIKLPDNYFFNYQNMRKILIEKIKVLRKKYQNNHGLNEKYILQKTNLKNTQQNPV